MTFFLSARLIRTLIIRILWKCPLGVGFLWKSRDNLDHSTSKIFFNSRLFLETSSALCRNYATAYMQKECAYGTPKYLRYILSWSNCILLQFHEAPYGERKSVQRKPIIWAKCSLGTTKGRRNRKALFHYWNLVIYEGHDPSQRLITQ